MSTIIESVDVAVDVPTAYNQWTQFESFPTLWKALRRYASSTIPTFTG
jgi:hypothetical protein